MKVCLFCRVTKKTRKDARLCEPPLLLLYALMRKQCIGGGRYCPNEAPARAASPPTGNITQRPFGLGGPLGA